MKDIAAGGQTWAHSVRMIRQVFKIVSIASLSISILFFIVTFSLKTSKRDCLSVYYSTKAAIYKTIGEPLSVSPSFWKAVHGRGNPRSIPPNLVLETTIPYLSYMWLSLKTALFYFYVSFSSLFGIFLFFFMFKGKFSKKKEHLSGIKILSDVALTRKLKLMRKSSDIRLGSVPLLKGAESKHMLISGTTGSGKSNCLNQLLLQIRKRGDRAVIVDTTSSFTSSFYREGKDILLNPYDSRSARWQPWCECDKDYHYEQLVNSLIPSMHHPDDFFSEAGRAVVYSALRKAGSRGDYDIEEFVTSMLRKSITELYEDLKDTDAAVYVDPKADKTAASIRATIANSLRHFRPLKKTKEPFSIRDWILTDTSEDPWLFISCTTEQRRSINRLMSVWFSVAINAMKAKSLEKGTSKIWFIIDELQSLQKLEYLEESLAELNKYGGCIVIATQDVSQIDKLYGAHSTKTIINLCGTKLCFRQEDPDIARRMSRFFGEREFKEVQEGLSYGAHEMRDGVSLSTIEKTKPTVAPTKILELKDLEAFIKLPGGIPAAKTRFKYQKMHPLTDGFKI